METEPDFCPEPSPAKVDERVLMDIPTNLPALFVVLVSMP
jgi:hypothetical protein